MTTRLSVRPPPRRRRLLYAAGAWALLSACASEGVLGSLEGKKGAPAAADAADVPDAGPFELAPATTAIAAGGASTCVKNADGEARCWGEHGTGSLGIGESSIRSSAKPVTPQGLGAVEALFGGERSQCALRAGGRLFCWGDLFVEIVDSSGVPLSDSDHLPVVNPFSLDEIIGSVARVGVGRYFMCALTTAGDVRCFGRNDRGQLGIGASPDKQALPTTMNGLDGPATSIAASMGGQFACATTRPGTVHCWGDDTDGQIGGGTGPVVTPRKIEGLSEAAVEVVAGGSHACARLASGRVACWGRGDEGQLGDGNATSSAVPITLELSDVTALAAGRAHTCAVRSEGSVFCWGDDSAGQAGGGPAGKRPWIVLGSEFRARYVSCGLAHTCAWGEGGRVRCWGSNADSQLGPEDATL